MEKAYDIKDLLKRLEAKGLVTIKESGLQALEDGVIDGIPDVFDWLEESAVLSSNKIDDVVSIGYPMIESKLLEIAAKIKK